MQKIAIDGRILQTKPYTGVSYYLKNILQVWSDKGDADTFRLYFNQSKQWKPPSFVNGRYVTSQSRIPSRLLQFFWSVSSLPSLESVIKEETIWLPNSNFLGSIGKKRLILSIHDLSFLYFSEFYSKKMRVWHQLLSIQRLVKKSDHIITFSNATKLDIIDYFKIKESRVTIIPHGVSSEYYEDFRDITSYKLPKQYIAFIGSIEPRKNVGTLLDAFEIIAKANLELHLVIVGGEGWLSKKLFRRIKTSTYGDRIHYKGYVSEDEKRCILKYAKVFAFPSFYEGFGLPVLEAMAAGCPVVVGATGSLPELVESSGILINPHQTHELASALELIINNSEVASAFSKSGKERAKTYTWEKSAESTLNILKGNI